MTEKKVTLAELAELVEGELVGDPDRVINNLNPIETAEKGDITFFVKVKSPEELQKSKASAAIVPLKLESADIPIIRVQDPYLASAKIQNMFLEKPFEAAGVHDKAYVGADCSIPDEITVGPMVSIGDRVIIGKRVTIEPGVVIGNDAEIGADTTIKANATIGERCTVGQRVLIHAGVVLGSDGYGFATDMYGCHVKRPQLGVVIVGDDVEIGANCCIDRATFGETRIRSGAKLDNLVHVAHNVDVGENSLLVAQAGIAGSTTLGRNVVVGGQSGIKDHLHIEDQVMIAPLSGVHNNQPKGSIVCGIPAIPLKKFKKAAIVFSKLPDMYRAVQGLKRQLKEMKKADD